MAQCCSLKVISTLLVVILAKAGIQKLRILPRKLDSRFRGSDDKSLSEQHCADGGLFISMSWLAGAYGGVILALS